MQDNSNSPMFGVFSDMCCIYIELLLGETDIFMAYAILLFLLTINFLPFDEKHLHIERDNKKDILVLPPPISLRITYNNTVEWGRAWNQKEPAHPKFTCVTSSKPFKHSVCASVSSSVTRGLISLFTSSSDSMILTHGT